MTNMTKAGEVGGFLDTVLLQIATNYEAETKLRGKVKAAMTYPVVVLCIALLAVVGMLLFIVPVFAGLFSSLGGTLPLPTRILVVLSKGLKIGIIPLIIGIIVGRQVWSRVKRKPQVRNIVDPLKLKLPVFGELMSKIALTRFSRNLGTMMSSGVPILQSLDIVAATTGNVVLERATRAVQDSVRTGNSLAGPLSEHKVFPPMVVQMMAVGEDTGADRAVNDCLSRRDRRRDDRGAVYADLQNLRSHQLATTTIHHIKYCSVWSIRSLPSVSQSDDACAR